MEDKNIKSQNAEREEKVLKFWEENKIFQKSLDKEKNNLRGIGTGATFRGYCLVVAGTISRMDPIGVPEEKYYEALRKVYTC